MIELSTVRVWRDVRTDETIFYKVQLTEHHIYLSDPVDAKTDKRGLVKQV